MSLLDFFHSLFPKGGQSVLGIDIGSSSVKVVQLKKKAGKAVLETYGELSLGSYAGVEIGRATSLPTDKIIQALRDVLKESNTTTIHSGLSIPASSSLLSFIKMPDLSEKELATMIPIEARKYIPVPISEVMLDWSIVPKDENYVSEFEAPLVKDSTQNTPAKNVEVLLAVIHNEVLSKYGQIVSGAGLENGFFEIEIFSTMRAVVEQSLEAQIIFDFGAGSTKLYIIDRGMLRTSHTISRGSQEITLALSRALGISVGDAEHLKRTVGISDDLEQKNVKEIITLNLDYIFAETVRVMTAYEKKTGKNISRVVLAGGGSLLKGFLNVARTRLETEVVLADPFSKTEAPAFLDPVLKEAGPEFAVAIGLALRQLQEME